MCNVCVCVAYYGVVCALLLALLCIRRVMFCQLVGVAGRMFVANVLNQGPITEEVRTLGVQTTHIHVSHLVAS